LELKDVNQERLRRIEKEKERERDGGEQFGGKER
jgi:hypothetical protein